MASRLLTRSLVKSVAYLSLSWTYIVGTTNQMP